MLSFIVVFYCSTVIVGKNTKRNKKVQNIAPLGTTIQICMVKTFEIILIWYFNFTDKLAT